MQLTVIGTGYVGLVAGACFADVGNDVVCVDVDEAKIASLRQGIIPIYEPGLEAMVKRNYEDGRLAFTTDAAQAVRDAEVVFIAVGTPPGEDGSADLQHVIAVAETIGDAMQSDKIVVCKSTVPIGTCDEVYDVITSRTDHAVDVISNPEFLKEGSALKDFQYPDRVIIGSRTEAGGHAVGRLYTPFMRRQERILYMDVRSAEMTKYASNSMLATKISFINEIANLCDAVGADVELVRRGMAMDKRIGPHFIYPGCGFGGSCFPKDIKALARVARRVERPSHILDAVDRVNDAQKTRLIDFAHGFYGGDFSGKTFAVWGLSFKPKTDDVREAPAHVAIRRLISGGATIRATDPAAIENSRLELADLSASIEFFEGNYETLDGADALFVFTEWNEFRSPNFERMKQHLSSPVLFDGRNIYDPGVVRDEHGFTYFCIGRSTVERGW
ncbi:MAG: UDP-glucose/GDP-mannose dehydrogenase family protein [Myxococcota bacterium]